MKKILIYLLRFGLNCIYMIFKLMPVEKNKVLFLSRQSDELTLDFRLVQEALKNQCFDVKIVTICHRTEDGKSGGCLGMIQFAAATLKSMFHMATGKVCVLDAYWPAVSLLHHKKNLKVIQMWHALGKIKQSGYQTLGKESGRNAETSRLLKMHENYDYIIAGGKAWNPFYCQSFGTTEDKLVNCGLPRIDHLLETQAQNRESVYEHYPELRGKEVILYAPTFRRNIELHWEVIIEAVTSANEKAGWEKYALIVKGHPNQKLTWNNPMVYQCDEFKAVDLLAVCSFLITDYSAIAIEGAVLNKQTYYFVYDYEEYRKKNGMNIDLFQTMPGCVYRDGEALMEALTTQEYPQEALDKYREKYLPEHLGTSTVQITKLILEQLDA